MNEGLLWLDADKKRDLAEKVARAAARYAEKFGQRPNLCHVHPSTLDGPIELDGVRVVPAPNILKHHFWVGVEENGTALKAEAPPRTNGKRYVCKRCEAEALDPQAKSCWNCGYSGEAA